MLTSSLTNGFARGILICLIFKKALKKPVLIATTRSLGYSSTELKVSSSCETTTKTARTRERARRRSVCALSLWLGAPDDARNINPPTQPPIHPRRQVFWFPHAFTFDKKASKQPASLSLSISHPVFTWQCTPFSLFIRYSTMHIIYILSMSMYKRRQIERQQEQLQ